MLIDVYNAGTTTSAGATVTVDKIAQQKNRIQKLTFNGATVGIVDVSYLIAVLFYFWRGYEVWITTQAFAVYQLDRDLLPSACYSLTSTFFMVLLVPGVLTMRCFAEERRTGSIEMLLTAPVRDVEIVLGKWIAHVLVVWGYLLLLAGGVIAIAWGMGRHFPQNAALGLASMGLGAVVLVSLSVAGGARLSTVTNGVLAFGLYGIAFLGSWVEQFGSFTKSDATRNIGTIASLIMPSESMWQLASHLMQPAFLLQMRETPFSLAPMPSPAMVVWAVLWSAAVLASGIRAFQKRAL